MKHFDCFGDNRRTNDTRKITLCGLKACCLTLYSVAVKMNTVPKKSSITCSARRPHAVEKEKTRGLASTSERE